VTSVSVMLVDDNAMFAHLAARYLAECSQGEVVVTGVAYSAEEALDLAPGLEPQVILLDLVMPGMTGLEAIPYLRVLLPKAAVIVLTSYHDRAYKEAALAAGAHDFVSKRSMDTDLLPAIRRVVQAELLAEKRTILPL
jgi:DNA-binding NarL/FixJ family response regulator